MTNRLYQYKLSIVLLALGYEDVNEENSPEVVRYLDSEVLEGVVNDTIKHNYKRSNGSPPKSFSMVLWAPWWFAACKQEVENRIEKALLG